MTNPLLTVADLVVEYRLRAGRLRAVDGVSLEIKRGETLALVGESGCGKSTLGRAITRLVPVTAGHIVLDGVDLLRLRRRSLQRTRRRVQIVFQDPVASLNSRMTVRDLVREPLLIHGVGNRHTRRHRVDEILALVGLDPQAAERFPHQFSGGQRQRIALARALVLEPDLLVADEPTASLDVSIQAQILLLLQDVSSRLGLAMLFISHDLAVVRALADRVAVMYLGRIVETATRHSFYQEPRHPYSRALLRSAPRLRFGERPLVLAGEVPSALRPPHGCRFRTRCQFAIERCAAESPPLRLLGAGSVACHRAEEPDLFEPAAMAVSG